LSSTLVNPLSHLLCSLNCNGFDTNFSHSAVNKFYKDKIAELQQGLLQQDALQAAVDGLEEVDGLQQKGAGQADSKAVAETEEEADNKEQENQAKRAAQLARTIAWKLGRASQIRKRQAISHAFSIELLFRGSFKPDDLEDLRIALREVAMKRTILEQIRSPIGTHNDISRYERGLQQLQQQKEAVFGKFFDMDQLLILARDESAVRDITCRLCNDATPPVQPMRLPIVSRKCSVLLGENGC
jgi:hypothetical protein